MATGDTNKAVPEVVVSLEKCTQSKMKQSFQQ